MTSSWWGGADAKCVETVAFSECLRRRWHTGSRLPEGSSSPRVGRHHYEEEPDYRRDFMTMDGPDGQIPSVGKDGALVLVVDDNVELLCAWPYFLAGLPIRLKVVESAEKALEAIRSEVPAVLVSDQRMPGMTGLQLIEQVKKRWPEIRLALHTSDPAAQTIAYRLRVPVLEKGAPGNMLRDFIQALLPRSAPAEQIT